MKLQVTFESEHPARIAPVDGAVATVFQDERPLSGLAVRADWRLNGFLSRLLMAGRFTGEPGEWLLVHTQGRLPFTHLFLVGMGRRGDHGAVRARQALQGIAAKLALAGIHALAIDLEQVAGEHLPAGEAMEVFLQALGRAYPEDEAADPPYPPARQALQRNERRKAEALRRRERLQEARRRLDLLHRAEREAEQAAEALVGEVGEDEPPVPDAAPERPVAGGVPEELIQRLQALREEESRAAEAVRQAEQEVAEVAGDEPPPERTVRVVLLGSSERLASLRKELGRIGRSADSGLDVDTP